MKKKADDIQISYLMKLKKRRSSTGYKLEFFKNFIERAVNNVKENDIKQIKIDNTEKALIYEIKKKTGIEKKKKKQLPKNIFEEYKQINNKNNNDPPEAAIRNINKILFCLKKLKKFNEFVKFNNINFDQLEKFSAYIKHQFIAKNELLYKRGKRAKKFYCVINGSISVKTIDPLRIEKEKKLKELNNEINEISDNNSKEEENNNYKDDNRLDILLSIFNKGKEEEDKFNNDEEEYEIQRYTKGMCFGEWDLIRNNILLENAYAAEDTNIFYLDKEYFDRFISSQIIKSDIERKYFITYRIPLLNLDNIKYVKPEFYQRGNIIYTEFDEAKEAIIIYKGAAAITILSNAQNKKDIYDRKKELKVIAKVEKGALVGLEIGKSKNEKGDIYYDNTLIVMEDNTIIFRLNIDNIKGKTKKLMRHLRGFFSELYIQQNDFINNLKIKSQKLLKINKELTIEDKRMITLNKIFDSLSHRKIKLKGTKIEKNKNELAFDSNNENIYSSYRINNIYLRRANNIKTEYNNTFFDFRDSRNMINLKTIDNNKLISKNSFNKLMKNPLLLSNNLINYNNYAKYNSSIKENTNYNSINRNMNDSNSQLKIYSIDKNSWKQNLISLTKNNYLKYNNNNSNRTLKNNSSIHKRKIFNLGNSKTTVKINKYVYDSGKFKIPLLSLGNI